MTIEARGPIFVTACDENPPCGEAMGRWQREALTEGR